MHTIHMLNQRFYILVLLECFGEIWRVHHVRERSNGTWHNLPKRCIDASTHIELEVVVTLKIPNLCIKKTYYIANIIVCLAWGQ